MRTAAWWFFIVLLSGCATGEQWRTSSGSNGQSYHSFDVTDPRFYMDDDAGSGSNYTPSAPAAPHYGIDSYCGYCQHH